MMETYAQWTLQMQASRVKILKKAAETAWANICMGQTRAQMA